MVKSRGENSPSYFVEGVSCRLVPRPRHATDMATIIDAIAPGVLEDVAYIVQQSDEHTAALRVQLDLLRSIRPAGFRDGTRLDQAYGGGDPRTAVPPSAHPVVPPPPPPPPSVAEGAVGAGAAPSQAHLAPPPDAPPPASAAVADGAAPPPATEVPSGEEAEDEENEFDGFADPAEALSPEELKAQRKEAARLERNFREREKRRLAKAEREAEKNIVKESAAAAVGSKRCAATDATKPGDSTSKPSSSSTSSRSASKRPRPPDFAAASCSCPWPCHNPAHRG